MGEKNLHTSPNSENKETENKDGLPFDVEGFTPTQIKAIVELSQVPTKFKTQTELCNSLGIDRKTLWNWQQKPEFKGALTAMARFMLKNTGYIAYTGLLKSCAKGNPQALKLYFQYAENWSEKTILEHEGKGIALPTTVNVNLGDPEAIKEATGVDLLEKTEKSVKKS